MSHSDNPTEKILTSTRQEPPKTLQEYGFLDSDETRRSLSDVPTPPSQTSTTQEEPRECHQDSSFLRSKETEMRYLGVSPMNTDEEALKNRRCSYLQNPNSLESITASATMNTGKLLGDSGDMLEGDLFNGNQSNFSLDYGRYIEQIKMIPTPGFVKNGTNNNNNNGETCLSIEASNNSGRYVTDSTDPFGSGSLFSGVASVGIMTNTRNTDPASFHSVSTPSSSLFQQEPDQFRQQQQQSQKRQRLTSQNHVAYDMFNPHSQTPEQFQFSQFQNQYRNNAEHPRDTSFQIPRQGFLTIQQIEQMLDLPNMGSDSINSSSNFSVGVRSESGLHGHSQSQSQGHAQMYNSMSNKRHIQEEAMSGTYEDQFHQHQHQQQQFLHQILLLKQQSQQQQRLIRHDEFGQNQVASDMVNPSESIHTQTPENFQLSQFHNQYRNNVSSQNPPVTIPSFTTTQQKQQMLDLQNMGSINSFSNLSSGVRSESGLHGHWPSQSHGHAQMSNSIANERYIQEETMSGTHEAQPNNMSGGSIIGNLFTGNQSNFPLDYGWNMNSQRNTTGFVGASSNSGGYGTNPEVCMITNTQNNPASFQPASTSSSSLQQQQQQFQQHRVWTETHWKKILKFSDTDTKLFLGKVFVEDHIRKHLPKEDNQKIRESEPGTMVKVYDHDMNTYHDLFLAVRQQQYILKKGWKEEFVERRMLRIGEQIGLFWDSSDSMLYFRVLSRAISKAPAEKEEAISPVISRRGESS